MGNCISEEDRVTKAKRLKREARNKEKAAGGGQSRESSLGNEKRRESSIGNERVGREISTGSRSGQLQIPTLNISSSPRGTPRGSPAPSPRGSPQHSPRFATGLHDFTSAGTVKIDQNGHAYSGVRRSDTMNELDKELKRDERAYRQNRFKNPSTRVYGVNEYVKNEEKKWNDSHAGYSN
eukprot:gnl/Hemi2/15292_TR5155_c0_g1_i1.p1 gnl/Hemi2/15292_TR5155_c0_g1~~gnl/Hemi2/15292_TR5155_c0_g1_i1.p1  ORF type:complete len:180 (-),score=13.33 gnl/Hemi2/15292_TR5155_c0_g1_i1:168-707(-)